MHRGGPARGATSAGTTLDRGRCWDNGVRSGRSSTRSGAVSVCAERSLAETVVVIGNGMVGHRFCERLREGDREERFEIIVFGEEPRPAYDRVHLSDYFAGKSAGGPGPPSPGRL